MLHIVSLIQTLAKGGPVMIALVICSVVALAVVIERLGFWWRHGDVGPAERALDLAERGTVHGGIPVNLPKAARAEAARTPVSVSREGLIYLEREPVDAAQLGARLQARARTGPELTIVIEADTDVPHGRVVDVMDAARLAGVGKLAIAVTPRETKR